FSDSGLRKLLGAPGHRSGSARYELDTGRKIRLSEVCRLYVCDSSAAGPSVAAPPRLRIPVEASRGRPSGSAAGLGRKRVSRSQSVSLCICESVHAAQYLPCSRAVTRIADEKLDGG